MKSIPETDPVHCFLDSNIWLYAFIRSQHPGKSDIAKALLRTNEVIVSTQVINEVSINLIKKAGFNEGRIRALIASFYQRQEVVETGLEVLLAASTLRSRYRFSFWDSLIVSGALMGEVSVLYSEDMHDGLVVDNQLQNHGSFHAGQN